MAHALSPLQTVPTPDVGHAAAGTTLSPIADAMSAPAFERPGTPSDDGSDVSPAEATADTRPPSPDPTRGDVAVAIVVLPPTPATPVPPRVLDDEPAHVAHKADANESSPRSCWSGIFGLRSHAPTTDAPPHSHPCAVKAQLGKVKCRVLQAMRTVVQPLAAASIHSVASAEANGRLRR